MLRILTMNMCHFTCHGSSYQPLFAIVLAMVQDSHTMPTTDEYCDVRGSIGADRACKRTHAYLDDKSVLALF